MGRPFRIGTRASPLALAQAGIFADALRRAHGDIALEIVRVTTSGDRSQARNVSLAAAGGDKGLFVKELEEALLDGRIDCAVHSMKDVPSVLPEGLVIPCLLPREDPREVFLSRKARRLQDLPRGAVFGTSSPRRKAIVLAARPDLKVVEFRGNVDTRLKKLADGEADATALAAAGLRRLGRMDLLENTLSAAEMLPAAGQGAVGIEIREGDQAARTLVMPVHDVATGLCVAAERMFLKVMEGSCRTPLGALMMPPDPGGRARLDVLAAETDGSNLRTGSYLMSVLHEGDAERLGAHAAAEMKKHFPADGHG